MKTLEVKRLHELGGLLRELPKESEYKTFIDEDTTLTENGKVVAVYRILSEEQVALAREIALSTKPVKTQRVWALPTQSSVFGALPRVPLRVDYCRYSNKSKEERENFARAVEFSKVLCEIYKTELPQEYERALEEVRQTIDGSWRPIDTPFTTCNFNINHAIKYHFDSGNVKQHFSNVLILKKDVVGGYLVCPEYELAFSQRDRALIIFDGQSILHGVTPIKALSPTGYRASIVYYTLSNMKHCYPYQKELERIKTVKTERARKRLLSSRPELEVVRRRKKEVAKP